MKFILIFIKMHVSEVMFMLTKKFIENFGRTPTHKEAKVLEYIKSNCYGEYLNVDPQMFIEYFCKYYYYCISKSFI
ncbi:hypothetical protein [Ilyobacter sp.]|uniref:hypothetical protein n=1 Tax=Ilyobacter sp. TaxID=3100343 RepID=UPI003565F6DA